MTDITVGIAFIAGLVSFISPCVLPLVPAYVGYMGGQVTSQVSAVSAGGAAVARRNRFGTFLHGVFFVLGFTFVFVAFGLLTTAGSLALRGSVVDMQEILTRLGGLLIIFFGLHIMGTLQKWLFWLMGKTDQMNSGIGYALTVAGQLLIAAVLAWSLVTPLPIIIVVGLYLVWLLLGGAFVKPGDFWEEKLGGIAAVLYTDTRRQMQPRNETGYLGSALMGVVFSAGWTPCIGPVYGAVLTLAANGGSLSQAGVLLTAYSLGLGVPFLLTALALDQMQGLLRRLQKRMRTIELVSGVFLIVIGLLVLTGQLQQLSQIGSTGDFAYNLEHCTTELFSGGIALNEFGACMDVGPNYGAEDFDALAPPAEEQSSPADGEGAVTSMLDNLDALEAEPQPLAGLEVGLLAPAFETTTAAGDPVSLADYRGQVVVLNFWATWCGPCRVEMPELQAVYEAYDDVVVVGVNRGESMTRIADFREEFAVTFPLLLDEDESITAVDYQVVSMPTTYVLDAEGVIVARHLGAVTEAQLDEYLEVALAPAAE